MKGAIEPLNKWIAADKTSNLSVYFPEVVRALRFAPAYKHIPVDQRELYAYPIHFSTDVLFYNKDMFKAAHVPYPTDNWTWAQMVDAAKKLTIRDSEGHVTQFGLFLPEADATIQSNGGSVFNSDYSKCIIASPQALEAMIELRDLRYKYGVSPTPAQVQDSSSMQMFKLGELAMLPGRTYMTVDFNKITAFGYDVARMPGMKKPLARLAVGGICMSRDVDQKHKEAAFRWMKYYCSPNGGQRFFGSEKNCVTAVKAYAYSPDFFLKPPPANSKILVDSLKNSQITVPPILGASEYLNKIYTPQRDDMLRYPDGDLMKALRQFQSDTNALLQKEPKG
jgi:multiple sugar transport system substrate-binding protein